MYCKFSQMYIGVEKRDREISSCFFCRIVGPIYEDASSQLFWKIDIYVFFPHTAHIIYHKNKDIREMFACLYTVIGWLPL